VATPAIDLIADLNWVYDDGVNLARRRCELIAHIRWRTPRRQYAVIGSAVRGQAAAVHA
jgi:hypothetical protein